MINDSVPERGFILVVEDGPDDFVMIDRAFKKTGTVVSVKHFWNGVEARSYLNGDGGYADRAQHPLPALILADLKMPLMTGLELLEWVRATPHLDKIPFILISSSDSPRDIKRASELGASSYLVKPSRFDSLVAALKTVVNF